MLIEMSDTVFGRNILYLRKKYKLSRTALCNLTEINYYFLRDWEEEEDIAVLTWKQMKRLCAVFDISAESLAHTELDK